MKSQGDLLAIVGLRHKHPDGKENIAIEVLRIECAAHGKDWAEAQRTYHMVAAIARLFNAGGTLDECDQILSTLRATKEEMAQPWPEIDTSTWEPCTTRQPVPKVQHVFRNVETDRFLIFVEDGYVEDVSFEDMQDLLEEDENQEPDDLEW